MRKPSLLGTTLMVSTAFLWSATGHAQNTRDAGENPPETQSTKSNEDLPLANYFEHEIFTLNNGLTVLVHEDPSKSEVAVSVTFHVGSKDEPEGKSGFAHVFEHLAFNGTKRNPGEYFTLMNQIGGSATNGSTGYDYTNYFQVVPRRSLERLLWIEADRMMNVGNDATQESLNTQIDVIINEKRLSENRPFGGNGDFSAQALYPANHPYSHTVIGSEEDLRGATLDDVKKWYEKYYGASNALLTMAGNITTQEGRALAEKYFGHVPPGPSLAKMAAWHVDRETITRQENYDISPVSEIRRGYSLPAIDSAEDTVNAMVFMTLGQGETSFLRKRLVEELGVAVQVSGSVYARELDAVGSIAAYPADGVSLETLSGHLDQAIADFMRDGPSAEDVENIYGTMRSSIIDSSDSITAKAVYMAADYYALGDPLFRLRYADWVRRTKPEDIRRAAQKILPVGYHEERNYAQPEFKAAAISADIDTAPEIGSPAPIAVADPTVFTLDNGLRVVAVDRPASPLIAMELSIPRGADNLSPVDEEKLSVAMEFAAGAGAGGLSKQEQATKLASLGASIGTRLRHDRTSVSVTADSFKLKEVTEIFAGMLADATFGQSDFSDFMDKKIENARVAAKDVPTKGSEVFNAAFYGADNVVSSEDQLRLYPDFDRTELQGMVAQWLKPQGATLYVSGDVRTDKLADMLNAAFAGWQGSAPGSAEVAREYPAAPAKPKFILINNEGANQTEIAARRRLPSLPDQDNYLEKITNEIFGGSFTSRLNTNIREDKGWTYGIRQGLNEINQIDYLSIGGSVTDVHTVDAIKEIIREMREMRGERPVTAAELSEVVNKRISTFSADTNYAVIEVLEASERYAQDFDYFEGMADRYNAITTQQVNARAKEMFVDNEYVWVLIGDLDTFEAELRAANLGDVEVYDAAGKRVR